MYIPIQFLFGWKTTDVTDVIERIRTIQDIVWINITLFECEAWKNNSFWTRTLSNITITAGGNRNVYDVVHFKLRHFLFLLFSFDVVDIYFTLFFYILINVLKFSAWDFDCSRSPTSLTKTDAGNISDYKL